MGKKVFDFFLPSFINLSTKSMCMNSFPMHDRNKPSSVKWNNSRYVPLLLSVSPSGVTVCGAPYWLERARSAGAIWLQ